MEFAAALETFLAGAQKVYDDFCVKQGFDQTRIVTTIEATEGPSFYRVIRHERFGSDGHDHAAGDTLTRSAYGFIAKVDGSNRKLGNFKAGDVFKADGWNGPASGVRGNLFDARNGLGRASEYSIR